MKAFSRLSVAFKMLRMFVGSFLLFVHFLFVNLFQIINCHFNIKSMEAKPALAHCNRS